MTLVSLTACLPGWPLIGLSAAVSGTKGRYSCWLISLSAHKATLVTWQHFVASLLATRAPNCMQIAHNCYVTPTFKPQPGAGAGAGRYPGRARPISRRQVDRLRVRMRYNLPLARRLRRFMAL